MDVRHCLIKWEMLMLENQKEEKCLLVLDLYTFRFGQKKLVRSEPSRIMKKAQTWVIAWVSLSSRSWLADPDFIILLKTRFPNLSSVFNFQFYESLKVKLCDFWNTKQYPNYSLFNRVTATVSLLETCHNLTLVSLLLYLTDLVRNRDSKRRTYETRDWKYRFWRRLESILQ